MLAAVGLALLGVWGLGLLGLFDVGTLLHVFLLVGLMLLLLAALNARDAEAAARRRLPR
jgi:hypothetical protein